MTVIHGGNVWQGEKPEDYLDFSANLNPEGPPAWVTDAMKEGLSHVRYYPEISGAAARGGIAKHLKLPADCVLVTSGGIEAAALAAKLPGQPVIAEPTFQEYGHLCGEYRTLLRSELKSLRFSKGDALWLCNPNNPTGDALKREEVLSLLDRAENAGARLVVDEAFIEYCPEHSVADCVLDHPALMVLGSLTKVLAIPGIRLGYMAAHPDVIRNLQESLTPWRLNCVAEAVAAALPGHEADFDEIRSLNDVRRSRFAEALKALGAEVHPSQANFLLCDFKRDMRPMIEVLRSRHILLRPCGMFPTLTHRHVRLCVRREGENERLARELSIALMGNGGGNPAGFP